MAVTAVRKVARDDTDSPDDELDGPLPDLGESRVEIAIGGGVDALLVPVPTAVVVPGEQHLSAVEHTGDGKGLVDAPHREVAEHDHLVLRRHRAVPAFDERVVHLVGIAERPAAVLDDVAMAEVKIGGEIAGPWPQGSQLASGRARGEGGDVNSPSRCLQVWRQVP